MLGRGDDLLANPTLLLTGLKVYYIHLVLIVTPERGKEDTERRASSEVMVSGKLARGKENLETCLLRGHCLWEDPWKLLQHELWS